MQGRVFGIKKSNILTFAFVLLTAVFIFFSLLTILVYNLKYLWFFIFCLSVGDYQLLKGCLFKYDSAFYFGVLLICVGVVGFLSTFTFLSNFQAVFYILSFAAASYFTFVFFSQFFHLWSAILLYFASALWLMVEFNLISIPIFVAIVASSVLIFVLAYTFTHKKAKNH